jgi:hypothetical protein
MVPKFQFCCRNYSTHVYWITPVQKWCFNPREIGLMVSRAGIFKVDLE